jgi:hypothetical protein
MRFKVTGKRNNPTTYVDVRVDSDRFDNEPDRYYLTIWAYQQEYKNMLMNCVRF